MIRPHKNPPKFFFNFIGPEFDHLDYMPITPETEHTIAVPASAIEDPVHPAVPVSTVDPKENPKRKEFRVQICENVETRTDKLKRKLTASGQYKRVGSDPSLFSLVEEDATNKKQKNVIDEREENPDIVEVNPDSPVVGLVAKRAQSSGFGSHGQNIWHKEIVMPEWMKNVPKWMREMWHATKTKVNEEKGKEKSADKSNIGKVIIKGIIKKSDDGRVSILCMCHDHAHTVEEFIKHAGGEESSDQTLFVIISSDNP